MKSNGNRTLPAVLVVTVFLGVGCAKTASLPGPTSQIDKPNLLINDRLKSLSSPASGRTIDCGITSVGKASDSVSKCASAASSAGKPFFALYSGPSWSFFQSAYGLAGDAEGNVYEVAYDSRGLLNLNVGKKSEVFDQNQIMVTGCIKPVHLDRTEEGIVACVMPVNEQASEMAAHLQPVETTVCAIVQQPSAFNNKMVRVHGYASGNFEYSELGADGCSGSLWFAYANGEGPPGLAAYVNGGARLGAEDSEGRLVLPIPVKVVKDTNFRRFQKLMKVRLEADRQSEKRSATTFTFYRVAATFIGRIDGVSNDVHAFHLKRNEMDRADYLGFGQMGLFDAQFVLQSVANDSVLESFPPTGPD